ncbi:hypothetical protein Tsubulata_038020 [Turnera subulata]|uniref:BHLH domain-containing protein n=1 Tax=Turnera subulata TaxID=218843 RepID=A0A9Q0GCL9_9ROSI|nr:hypothetical protein Tsubulata_038020 [Turnera subulata]
MMMDNKRSVCTIDQGSFTSLTTKRHKADFSVSAKERKEKVGERIVALQQLVSPYGKTDTASVLTEAMEYIQFLHEQVKVCSSLPYLITVIHPIQLHFKLERQNRVGSLFMVDLQGAKCSIPPKYTSISKAGETELDWANTEPGQHSLRSRGLCLVPISCTAGVARSNGADLWAPIKTSSPKLDKATSPFH